MKIFSPTGKRYMLGLLGALVGLVILDGVITEYLINGGLAKEGNPLLEPLVGDIGFMLLKVFGSLLCAFILWDVYRRFPRVAMAAAWCCTIAYGIIVTWNVSLLFRG